MQDRSDFDHSIAKRLLNLRPLLTNTVIPSGIQCNQVRHLVNAAINFINIRI